MACGCIERFSPTGVDRGRVCVEHTIHHDLMDACKAKNFDINIVIKECYGPYINNLYMGYSFTSADTVDIHTDEDGVVHTSKPKRVKGISFWESYAVAETEGDHYNKFIRVINTGYIMRKTYSIEQRISHWPWYQRLFWQLFPYMPAKHRLKDPE